MNALPHGRCLALGDTENLSGLDPAFATSEDFERGLRDFITAAPITDGSPVVVASHPNERALFAAARAIPQARRKTRHGEDGADLALIEEIADPAWVAVHFDYVVLGSGDGDFTNAVVDLRQHGVPTVVVSRSNQLSRNLASVAAELVLLPLTLN